jgi:hypothetical protein
VWRKDPRIQSKGMAADGRPAVDRLSLAASAPERTAVLPLLRRRRTFIVLSGAEELRLSRRLAGLWPAGRAGGGAGALAREAADGLLLSCCSEGAERGAAEQHVRAGGLKAICEHCSPGGGGEGAAGARACASAYAAGEAGAVAKKVWPAQLPQNKMPPAHELSECSGRKTNSWLAQNHTACNRLILRLARQHAGCGAWPLGSASCSCTE